MPSMKVIWMPTVFGMACISSLCPVQAQEAWKTDKQTGCKLVTIPEWNEADIQWIGDCREKFAEGLGVVKIYKGGILIQSFFGEIHRGRLGTGVIDKGGGYVASPPSAPESATPEAQRNEVIKTFEVAAAAAEAASARFSKAGKTDSARFYEQVAKRLSEQMD